jgi:2-iminobutanoate/2-iminopropanoate deaminase
MPAYLPIRGKTNELQMQANRDRFNGRTQGHRTVFTSGQAGLSPKTGEMVPGGIEAESRQTIENLAVILKAAGSSLEKVIKTTVYLKSMGDFAAMNVVYAEYFGEESPARTTIQAAALPKNALVEIDAIAIKCSGECECDDNDKDEGGCGCGCKG